MKKKPGLYIVFDKFPSNESAEFVEVEDEHGKSVGEGTCPALAWQKRSDGFVELGPFASMDSTEALDRLARYIMENVPGEPAFTQSFVDCAIRILEEQFYPLQQGLVMSYLASNEEVTAADLAKYTGRSASWAFQLLEKMMDDGLLAKNLDDRATVHYRRNK